jgi:hypothetical protein
MLKKFTKKPYVALVYTDVIWPDDERSPFKIVSSPGEYKSIGEIFKKPSVFTSVSKMLKSLNDDLVRFVENNKGQKIEGSKGIRLLVSGGGDKFGDADLEFTMPGINLNTLRDLFEYDDKKFLSFLVSINKQNQNDDFKTVDEFEDFYIHDFSFYYFVVRRVGEKNVYHLSYVTFAKVDE